MSNSNTSHLTRRSRHHTPMQAHPQSVEVVDLLNNVLVLILGLGGSGLKFDNVSLEFGDVSLEFDKFSLQPIQDHSPDGVIHKTNECISQPTQITTH